MRVYLREMGQVSLLTREGEVEIAKRIEAGEHAQQRAMLGTPFGVREVLAIAEELRKPSRVELKIVLDGLDDDRAEHDAARSGRRDFLAQRSRRSSALEAEVRQEARLDRELAHQRGHAQARCAPRSTSCYDQVVGAAARDASLKRASTRSSADRGSLRPQIELRSTPPTRAS